MISFPRLSRNYYYFVSREFQNEDDKGVERIVFPVSRGQFCLVHVQQLLRLSPTVPPCGCAVVRNGCAVVANGGWPAGMRTQVVVTIIMCQVDRARKAV